MRAIRSLASILLASAVPAFASITSASTQVAEKLFSPAEPKSVGLDAAKLEELARVVQAYVDAGAIVGAELAVIKDDRLVLDRAFGWKHREEAVRMEPGTIFCVRSMTKPVVGTAVQMLIDEKKLALGDRASKYLPSFDNDRSRAITVEQLLTHMGGLPLSGLIGKDPSKLAGIREVADAAGEKGPEFPPGERFNYSDDGTDTLGALVEIASGMKLQDFLAERIFTPLEMHETIAVVTKDHPLRDRVASAYAGGAGSWTRFFGPTDPPIFSTLLASQGLYCSVLDYARFLHLWKAKGMDADERLLSPRAVRRVLEPGPAMPYPTNFEGLEVHYGQLMQLWVDPKGDKDKARVFAFGHGGSDGTHAWVFPELDLMVFYFTQSRGNTTGIEIEKDVQRLLLDPLLGEKRAPPVSYTETELADYVGFYLEDDGDCLAIVNRHGGLAAELPGKGITDLVPTRKRDSFDMKLGGGSGLDFVRAESGAVEAAENHGPGRPQRRPRIVPSADLPSVDAIMELRRKAVDWTKIDAAGMLRWRSKLAMPTPKLEGPVVSHARGLAQFKSAFDFGAVQGSATLDGAKGWSWSSAGKLEELSGERLNALHAEHPLLPIADWRKEYAEVRVLTKAKKWNDADAWIVRAIPADGPAHTWYVSAESGLPLALFAITPVPGVGEVGIITRYEDWRDAGPIRLPFHSYGKYASPLLGSFDVRVESIETNVQADGNVFSVDAERAASK